MNDDAFSFPERICWVRCLLHFFESDIWRPIYCLPHGSIGCVFSRLVRFLLGFALSANSLPIKVLTLMDLHQSRSLINQRDISSEELAASTNFEAPKTCCTSIQAKMMQSVVTRKCIFDCFSFRSNGSRR